MAQNFKYIIGTGIIVPDTQEIIDEVKQEWTGVFGDGFNTDPSEPQGAIIEADAIARAAIVKNNAELANIVNPNYSYGVALDSICALTGIPRGRDLSTIGQSILVTGTPGTVVTAGSRVKTQAGDIFTISTSATIGLDRSARATIASQEPGNIPLPEGTLEIVDGIIGWGSCEVLAGSIVTPGTKALSDGQLKAARNKRLFTNGRSSTGAILAAAYGTRNVTSAQVIENDTGQVTESNGVTFTLPSATWVCIAGAATDQAIADSLFAARRAGCPWDFGAEGMGTPVNPPNGIQVVDPESGKPYYVKFTRPIKFDVYVYMTVKQNQSTADNDSIRQAIVDYANGLIEGESGFIVGASVSAFELSGAVSSLYPGLFIADCKIAVVAEGSLPPVYPTDYVLEKEFAPYEQAQTNISFINVSGAVANATL